MVAQQGAPQGTAFRGDIQVKGRGRNGRDWVSPEGNLYISILLRPDRPMVEWPCLSLLAAVALHDAVSSFRGKDRVTLKWPNDILLDGRKCAGLLLEISGNAVILGCGVNCINAPDEVSGWKPGSLNQKADDAPVTADQVLSALEVSLIARYNDWQMNGFDRHRLDWIGAAAHIGMNLLVDMGAGAQHEGVFETLASDGSLALRLASGELINLPAGDVVRARLNGETDAAGD